MTVVVVGAGIGGLATALFGHHHGLDVEVHEAAAEVRELGVGINLQPHAMRELARIGLLEDLVAAGNPCRSWSMYNRFGQQIWTEPRGTAAGHPWPQLSIHRGRLQAVLLDAVRRRLGADSVRTGHRLTEVVGDDGPPSACFRTADGDRLEVRGDVIVGADGIHSTVRRGMYPDEGPPCFAGHILWRGVSWTEPYLDGASMVIAGHDAQKFIAYPITPTGPDGRCLVNWIAEVRAGSSGAREDWNRTGRIDDVLPLYRDWRFDWLDVPELVRGAHELYEFPMIDRDPLPRWTDGATTLLGDAAHPMYPIGANGASQAVRDASTLAETLAGASDPLSGLREYEADRRPATTRIVYTNRALGPEQVMQLAHERAPAGFTRIEDVVSSEELQAVARRYDDITWARADRP